MFPFAGSATHYLGSSQSCCTKIPRQNVGRCRTLFNKIGAGKTMRLLSYNVMLEHLLQGWLPWLYVLRHEKDARCRRCRCTTSRSSGSYLVEALLAIGTGYADLLVWKLFLCVGLWIGPMKVKQILNYCNHAFLAYVINTPLAWQSVLDAEHANIVL